MSLSPTAFLCDLRLLTNDPAGDGPGGDVNALLHERSQRKPEAVDDTEVVRHLKQITLLLQFRRGLKSFAISCSKFCKSAIITVVPDIDSSICHSYGENLKNHNVLRFKSLDKF